MGASPPCSLYRTLRLREARKRSTFRCPGARARTGRCVLTDGKPGSQTAGHSRRGQHPRTMGRMAALTPVLVCLDQSHQCPAPTPQLLCECPLQPRRVTAPFTSFQAGPCIVRVSQVLSQVPSRKRGVRESTGPEHLGTVSSCFHARSLSPGISLGSCCSRSCKMTRE